MIDEENLLLQIGNKLKELRIKSGYSSYENFAFDHDLPRMQYWRMERGKSNLTLRSLRKVLIIHKVNFSEFFNDLKI